MEHDLENIIKNIYKEFQKYTVKGNLRGRSCDCCVTNEEIRELLIKDLEALTYEDIYHFMTSAVSTYGDIDDYKHFLPRILELMQELNSDIIDDFLTFEKLDYSEWETWDTKEVDLIESYFYALFESTLLKPEISISDFEQKFMLFSKYLGIEKALELLEDKCLNGIDWLIVEYILNGFTMSLNKKDAIIFLDWLHSDSQLDRLEKLFLKTANKTEANRISIAYTIVDNSCKF